MKNLLQIIILIIFCLQANLYAQTNKILIGKIDASIIKLNNAAKSNNAKSSQIAIKELDSIWARNKYIILDKYHCSPFEEISACTMDGTIAILYMYHDSQDYTAIKKASERLVYVFQDIKENKKMEQDPVDLLWDTYLQYEEIHITVHDKMFGLREWFEFEGMVNGLSEELNIYNSLDFSKVQEYFPNILREKHDNQLEKVNNCFLNFVQSLESGYNDDFEWPCDELGKALYDLLLLYGK